MSKKIYKLHAGDVWTVGSPYSIDAHEPITMAYINQHQELVNIDGSGESWVLNDDYWAVLVKRIQKGDGEKFVPEGLVEVKKSKQVDPEAEEPLFTAGYYYEKGEILWRRDSDGKWFYFDGEWFGAYNFQNDDFFSSIHDLRMF